MRVIVGVLLFNPISVDARLTSALTPGPSPRERGEKIAMLNLVNEAKEMTFLIPRPTPHASPAHQPPLSTTKGLLVQEEGAGSARRK